MGTLSFAKNNGLQIPIYGEGSGGDPTAKARTEFSNTRERTGSTAAQRKGLDSSYIPGYGHPAAANTAGGLLDPSIWNARFRTNAANATAGSNIASSVAMNAMGIPTIIPAYADPHISTPANPSAMVSRTPTDAAVVADQGDWRGKVGVANPPPPTVPSNIIEQPTAYDQNGMRQERSAESGTIVPSYNPNMDLMNSRFQDPSLLAATGADRAVAIPQRYGGGVGTSNFVHDARSNVDAAGNPIAPKPVAQAAPIINPYA